MLHSNSFLPSRSNGLLFTDFVDREKDRNSKNLKEKSKISSSSSWPPQVGNTKTRLDGDYRQTSFNSIPLRTSAKTLHQLIRESPWSSKSAHFQPTHLPRIVKFSNENEIHTGDKISPKHIAKDSGRRSQSASTGKSLTKLQKLRNKKLRKQKSSHSKDEDVSSLKRGSKADSDELMVFYPLHGKPFLSFPPSKSFSSIAKRQIY